MSTIPYTELLFITQSHISTRVDDPEREPRGTLPAREAGHRPPSRPARGAARVRWLPGPPSSPPARHTVRLPRALGKDFLRDTGRVPRASGKTPKGSRVPQRARSGAQRPAPEGRSPARLSPSPGRRTAAQLTAAPLPPTEVAGRGGVATAPPGVASPPSPPPTPQAGQTLNRPPARGRGAGGAGQEPTAEAPDFQAAAATGDPAASQTPAAGGGRRAACGEAGPRGGQQGGSPAPRRREEEEEHARLPGEAVLGGFLSLQ